MTIAAKLLASRVPRYTSYPTAPHWRDEVDGETFRRWLAELPAETPLSLYFHIPFCDTLCWFCGCHTRVVNTYSPVAGYLELLLEEIDRLSRLIRGSRPVTHIHFGGGSPTMLSPQDFTTLCHRIRVAFAVSQSAEIAVEIDPRGLSDAMIAGMSANGVNRASIGVQDCDARVQKAINRIQPFSVTKSAVERLRAAGIQNLNLDLIYGLPHQTKELLEGSIARSVALDPDRIAIFGYAHVPHFKKHQNLIDASALPGVEERLVQFEAAHAMLRDLGYTPIGLDHFAKLGDPLARAAEAGTLVRNFQGYTTDNAAALIGFGASAISALPQGYAQNASNVPAYRKAIETSGCAVNRGIALTSEDRLRRAVIERLMCDLSVDLAALAKSYRVNESFSGERAALAPLAAEELVRIDGDRIAVPDSSRAALRTICAVFDQYLVEEGKHALAV